MLWFFSDEIKLCQDQIVNSQNNHWRVLFFLDVPGEMKVKFPVNIMLFVFYSRDKERNHTWLWKYLTLYSWEGSKILWYVWDKRRQTETAILTHNFFLAVQLNVAPARRPATRWDSTWLIESLLAASWDWIKTKTVSHVGICLYHFITSTHIR